MYTCAMWKSIDFGGTKKYNRETSNLLLVHCVCKNCQEQYTTFNS